MISVAEMAQRAIGLMHLPDVHGRKDEAERHGQHCYRANHLTASLAIFAVVAMLAPAAARDNGQWGDQPASVRQWFQSLMQPDAPLVSCCGQADAFEADQFTEDSEGQYVAIITDGKGIIPNGTEIHVPNGKIKWDQGNPTGHGIIFLGSPIGTNIGERPIYCFVPPSGV